MRHLTKAAWIHDKQCYGADESYEIGMTWLSRCEIVEDWGCSLAYAKKFRKGAYVGVDGTEGAADVLADLANHKSSTPGLFMRHVLEHNDNWRLILSNAIESFTDRMVLITFIEAEDQDRRSSEHKQWKRPEWSHLHLSRPDLMAVVEPYLVESRRLPRKKWDEVVYLLEKNR
jgi:hypothetical protein